MGRKGWSRKGLPKSSAAEISSRCQPHGFAGWMPQPSLASSPGRRMHTETCGHPRARTQLPKRQASPTSRSSALLWLCQPPCHEGPQTPRGGHLWHVEDFPSTLNSRRRRPTSHPSGTCSSERRPRAWRTTANRWDKPTGVAPMPRPTGSRPTHQELPAPCLSTAGSPHGLPSPAQHQEQPGCCTFPILQLPRDSLSKKPTVMPKKR